MNFLYISEKRKEKNYVYLIIITNDKIYEIKIIYEE